MTDTQQSNEREQRLNQIIAEYYRLCESGNSPDIDDFVSQHPEFAAELKSFFADKNHFDALAPPLAIPHEDKAAVEHGAGSLEPTYDSNGYSNLPIGARVKYFGDYEILDQIDKGGMGLVFKARQRQLGRVVALKVMRSGRFASKSEVDRFKAEARAAANLKHPNIVPVHEVGEHEGQYFFTMDFVEGNNLSKELREKPLPADRAASLVRTVARAIHYAHQEGLLHRDLKPSNVLLDSDGQPHVTDFGLAKRLFLDDEGTAAELTETGQILGTPSYMSPEQAAGKHSLIGPATDIYSLGALLYTLLTGRPPHAADSAAETIKLVLDQDPVAPRVLNPHIPRDLEAVCLRCLEKSPHRRYGTAELLAEDLANFLARRPTVARPMNRIARASRWALRNPAVASLSAAVLLAVFCGAVVSTVLAAGEHDQRIMAEDRGDQLELATGRLEESQVELKSALAREKAAREREQDARTRAEENERKAREAQSAAEQRRIEAEEARMAEEQQRSKAEQNEREARWHLYVARLYPMMQMWEDRDFGQLKVLIEETTPKPQDADFRGWEWYYLHDQYRQASRLLRHERGSYRGFGDWCGATGKIALSRSGAVDIWSEARHRIERTLRVGNSTVTGVAFHPDGNFIACNALRKLYVVNVATGDVKWECAIDDVRMEGDLGWSPSGDRLAFGGSDGFVRIWELESGRLLHEMTPTRGRPYLVKGLDWHPDGIHIATTAHHARCHIWNAETGDLVRTIKESGDDALTAVAWSSDGEKLALGGWNGISIRDEQGMKLDSMSADLSFRASLQWSRDDSRLLFGGGQSHTVGVWDFEIEEPLTFRLHTTGVVTVAWSPDEEKALAISGISPLGEARIFDVTSPAQKEIILPISEKNVPDVCWSPSGKFITCATAEGIVLCDPISGQVARRIAGGSVISTAWAPNGKQLAALEASSRVVIHTMSGEMGESTRAISPGRKMYDLDWSLDGKRLAVAGDGLTLFDVDSWRPIAPLNNLAFANAAKWSPDSRYLALAGHSNGRKGAGLGVFDANNYREVYYRPMGHTGRAVAWSPAGGIVAVGATAGWFRFYQADDGKLLHTAHGHKQQATGICWSPNGQRIATSAKDGQVEIWDAATGVNLISLPCDANVTCLAWGPDGRQLAGACSDGTLRIWGLSSIEVAPIDADHLESGVLASANQRRHGSYEGAATALRAQAKRMAYDPETRLLQQLNEAINSAPAEPSDYVKRSQFYTERLRWDEAAEDLARALEHSQQRGFLRCRLAQVALAQGDKTRYRAVSQLAFEEFQQMESPTPGINATVVSLMCLVPDRLMDYQSLVAAARKAAEEDVNAWHLRHPKLMVLYRAGNFDEAFAEVSQSHVIVGHPLQKTLVGYRRSMIFAKLGRHAEAKRAFEGVEQWWTVNKPVRNQPIDGWQVGLVIETLAIRPEARAMIESGSPFSHNSLRRG